MAPSVRALSVRNDGIVVSRPLASHASARGRSSSDRSSPNRLLNACELTTARLKNVAIPRSSVRGIVRVNLPSASATRWRLSGVPTTGQTR